MLPEHLLFDGHTKYTGVYRYIYTHIYITCICKVRKGKRERELVQATCAFLRSFPIFPQGVIKQWGGAYAV